MPYPKNRPQKLKGFTLSEMMIVLMLTTIAVGLAFSMLQLVKKQMFVIEENYGNQSEINRLRQALWIDFSTYPHVNFDAKTQILSYWNETGSLNYFFGEDLILREQDTIHVKLSEKLFFYDGSETASGAIDALELSTTEDQGSKTIFVHQTNAANEYLY